MAHKMHESVIMKAKRQLSKNKIILPRAWNDIGQWE